MTLPKNSKWLIIFPAVLFVRIDSVIGTASQSSAFSSSEESGESSFQQKHDFASYIVPNSSPFLLRLEEHPRIINHDFSKVLEGGIHDDNLKRLLYSQPRQKRNSQDDGGETNDVTVGQAKDPEKMEKEKNMENEIVAQKLEGVKGTEKLEDEKAVEKMAEEKGAEKMVEEKNEEKVSEEKDAEKMGDDKTDEEDDYDYAESEEETHPHSSSQNTFDDSYLWPSKYPGCDPNQNENTSPVDISTADIVSVKGTQTLLVFSDQPKPDTYIFSAIHNSEGVLLEGFSLRLKDEDVVRDATYISGLGSSDHRFFDNAIFFIRPLNENSTYSPLPPNRRAHTIDRKDFPMEIMFTFKTNLGQEITQIHVMVEIGEEDNPVWQPILAMLNPLIENVIHEKCFGAETARQQKEEMQSTFKAYKEMLSQQKKELVGSTYRENYNELVELYGYVNSANEENLMALNTTLQNAKNNLETCKRALKESTKKLPQLMKYANFMKIGVQKSTLKYRNRTTSKNRKPKELSKLKNVTESGTRTKREPSDEISNGTGEIHNDAKSGDDPKNDTFSQTQAENIFEDKPPNNDTTSQARKPFEDDPEKNDTFSQAQAQNFLEDNPGKSDTSSQAQAQNFLEDNPGKSDTSSQAQAQKFLEDNPGKSDTSSQAQSSKIFEDNPAKNSNQGANTTKSHNANDFKLKWEALVKKRNKMEKELQGKTLQLKMLTEEQLANKKCIESQEDLMRSTENELQRLKTLLQYYKIGSTFGSLYPSIAAVKEEMEKAQNNSERLEFLRAAHQAAVLNYDSVISQQQRSIVLHDPFHISWLFPARGGHYFYNGSSPIPPCSKRHYVIVFEDRITISKAQLKLFHKFPATKQKGTNTWSELCTDEFETTAQKLAYVEGMENMKNQVPEITPLGHRTVWYNPRNLQYKGDDGVHMLSRRRQLKKGKPKRGKR